MKQIKIVIVVPCSSLNEYVLECLRGCLRLDYSAYRIALASDASVDLP